MAYERNRQKTAELLKAGIVVPVVTLDAVTDKDKKIKIGYLVNAAVACFELGYPIELTCRIEKPILKEALAEIRRLREEAFEQGKFYLIGMGSIIHPSELEFAIEQGIDFAVAPSDGMRGGARTLDDRMEFVRTAHQNNVFAAPAAFTESEIGFYIARPKDERPDAIKIFNSEYNTAPDWQKIELRVMQYVQAYVEACQLSGDKKPDEIKLENLAAVVEVKRLGTILAPILRTDPNDMLYNAGSIFIPTGAVTRRTCKLFFDVIKAAGYTPVLGMSDPFDGAKKKAGGIEVYRASVTDFKKDFDAYTLTN